MLPLFFVVNTITKFYIRILSPFRTDNPTPSLEYYKKRFYLLNQIFIQRFWLGFLISSLWNIAIFSPYTIWRKKSNCCNVEILGFYVGEIIVSVKYCFDFLLNNGWRLHVSFWNSYFIQLIGFIVNSVIFLLWFVWIIIK